MFRSANNTAAEIEIIVDDETVLVPVGVTVAAALLLKNRLPTRTNPADGSARAPHCLMGACFECLVEIEGLEQRACQVVVHDGMRVTRKLGGTDA